MITLLAALVLAVVVSLQLKHKITLKERCMVKIQLLTIFGVSLLPTLVLAMVEILSIDLFGLCIIGATAMVYVVTKQLHINNNQYATCKR